MTEAGWTRGKDVKEAGWYWWRWSKKDDPEVLWLSLIAGKLRVFTMSNENCEEYIDDYDGEFLGPLSPTDRQQGRVEGRKEVLDSFQRHRDKCNDFRHCECAGGFWYEHICKPWMDEKEAQAAQDDQSMKGEQ